MQFSPSSSSTRPAAGCREMWRVLRRLLGMAEPNADAELAWVALITAQREQAERRREYERRQREIDRTLQHLASRARVLRHYADTDERTDD